MLRSGAIGRKLVEKERKQAKEQVKEQVKEHRKPMVDNPLFGKPMSSETPHTVRENKAFDQAPRSSVPLRQVEVKYGVKIPYKRNMNMRGDSAKELKTKPSKPVTQQL